MEQWESDGHPRHHGVWDSLEETWIVRRLTRDQAAMHAALLTLRYDAAGPRPEQNARYLADPVPVELKVTPSRTEKVLLHLWVREQDGWHGFVTYLEREPGYAGRWAPSAQLRPLGADELPTQIQTSLPGASGR